ncbi:MAG: glycosyltransferase family 4 protein [bacterium]
MHIIQLLPALHEGGVERGVVEMNRELVRRGVISTVISRGGRLAPEIEAAGGRHVTLDVGSKNPLTALWRARRLRQTLQELQPDLVHVRSRVPAWLLLLANRRLRLPVVSTVHGFNSVSAYSRIMTRADRVICASPAIREHVIKHYHTPEAILRLVPRGIDPQTFDPARVDLAFARSFRTQHGMDGRYLVLALGRITSWKGYDTLIRAAALAKQELPNLGVVIVGGVQSGQEAYATQLRRLADELGVGRDVVFCGSQSQVPEILQACDLLVSCASTKPETFGRSMAEALAMERPVVAARHGGALDIVRDGQNGLLFTPGDAAELARCLVAASRRTFTGLRADVLLRFSLKDMVDRTLAVYCEVLARSGEPADRQPVANLDATATRPLS